MTTVEVGQDFTAIVDYAHTPDSFEKLFKDMKPTTKGKLIVLFGSLGEGDKGKRPKQGQYAGQYADEVIICEEDDRQEDGQAIMEEIAKGAEAAGKVRGQDLFLVHDRPEAISFAARATPFYSWAKATKKPSNTPTANTPGTKPIWYARR